MQWGTNKKWNKTKIQIKVGMQVQKNVAEKWQSVTGNVLSVGYGLSETSPAASIDPIGANNFSDTLGLPLPSTLTNPSSKSSKILLA